MNKERLQYCIDIMKEAKNLDMSCHQYTVDVDSPGVVQTIEELHSCGNTACFSGYLAISPLFKELGGHVTYYGAPSIDGFEDEEAVFKFLEIDSDIHRIIIDGIIYSNSHLSGYVDELWSLWKPEHVIKILEGIMNNDPDLLNLYK